MKMEEKFQKLAKKISCFAGSAKAFLSGVLIVGLWAAAGPFFKWSDTHSLAINTFTTIITFLMCFLIQNTQNINDKALHLKLDELIRAIQDADNDLIGIEHKE